MAGHTQFLGFCDENLVFEEGPSRHGTRQPASYGFYSVPLQYSVPADRDFTLMTLLLPQSSIGVTGINNASLIEHDWRTRTEVPRRRFAQSGRSRRSKQKGSQFCLLEPVIYGPGPGDTRFRPRRSDPNGVARRCRAYEWRLGTSAFWAKPSSLGSQQRRPALTRPRVTTSGPWPTCRSTRSWRLKRRTPRQRTS